jgi:hypothetical protein
MEEIFSIPYIFHIFGLFQFVDFALSIRHEYWAITLGYWKIRCGYWGIRGLG